MFTAKNFFLLLVAGLLTASAASSVVAQTPTENPHTELTAERGEGIWTMLRRAGVTPTSSTVAEFKKLNADRLLRGDELVVGRAYSVPVSSVRIPLFGPAYQDVTIRSDRLKGAVYYIVSGHGGPDPGSIGTYGGAMLPEDEIAYDVSLRLARRLIEEGATVHVIVQDPDDGIRDGTVFPNDKDEVYLGGERIVLNHVRRLRDRARIINELYDEHRATARVQRVLSLHVDARGSTHEPQIDVHFQVASHSARQFSEVLQDTIRDQYDRVQPGRGYNGTVQFRNLYMLRETKPVATLVELGNIRHPRDQIRLTQANNRQALAEWLLKGLVRELELMAV